MSESTQSFEWHGALKQTWQEFSQQLVDYLPQFIGAFLLLLAGWAVATILRLLTRKFISTLDTLLLRASYLKSLQHLPLLNYGRFWGDLVFWSVLLFFLAATTHLLGWKLFAGVTTALVAYLPRLLAAFLIVLAGFAIGSMVRSAVASTSLSTGLAQTDFPARTAQLAVVVTALVIAVEQLGIRVEFLTDVLVVGVGVLLAGAALAFGLGAKKFISNIIGSQSARKLYEPGQVIRIAGVQGRLIEITRSALVLETSEGKAILPANIVQESIAEIIAEKS